MRELIFAGVGFLGIIVGFIAGRRSAGRTAGTAAADRHGRGRQALIRAIGVALAAVIISPIALSSSDLVAWAGSPLGLGLEWPLSLVVFVALDAVAGLCVGFVVYSAIRRESAGGFGLMAWAVAGGSALANYRHGLTTPAPDDALFFAAMPLIGRLLLHMTVHRVRRWLQISEGEVQPARARFGLRWLPGVSFRETLEAWQVSVQKGISRPDLALAFVRERKLLAELANAANKQEHPPLEAVRYAIGALGGTASVHEVRVWLAERKLIVDTATLEQVIGAADSAQAATGRTDTDSRVAPGGQAQAGAGDALPAVRTARAAARTADRTTADRTERGAIARERTDQLRERIAAAYADLVAEDPATAATRATRVAERIREQLALDKSARTIERYIHDLRRTGEPTLAQAEAAPAPSTTTSPAQPVAPPEAAETAEAPEASAHPEPTDEAVPDGGAPAAREEHDQTDTATPETATAPAAA